MLIPESHALKVQVETKFEVYDPRSFLTLLMQYWGKSEKFRHEGYYVSSLKRTVRITHFKLCFSTYSSNTWLSCINITYIKQIAQVMKTVRDSWNNYWEPALDLNLLARTNVFFKAVGKGDSLMSCNWSSSRGKKGSPGWSQNLHRALAPCSSICDSKLFLISASLAIGEKNPSFMLKFKRMLKL